MANSSEPRPADSRRSALGDQVSAREWRKIQSQQIKDRTLWNGISSFGVIGWSIAVPTLAGIGLGVWMDRHWPGDLSWTLTLLLAGVTLGCLSAWIWVSGERKRMDDDQKGQRS